MPINGVPQFQNTVGEPSSNTLLTSSKAIEDAVVAMNSLTTSIEKLIEEIEARIVLIEQYQETQHEITVGE